MLDRQTLQSLTRTLADEGRLVEAGWLAVRLTIIRPDAPESLVQEMRLVWMASAQHLFGSILELLDTGREPTEADTNRFYLIEKELLASAEEIRLWLSKPAGST